MGFLDPFSDGLSVGQGGFSRPSGHRRQSSRSRPKKRSRSRSRARSRNRSRSRSSSRRRGGASSFVGNLLGGGSDSHYSRHNQSGFFGFGDNSRSRGHNQSGFFGLGNSSRSSFFGIGRPSYYKRSPRQGFMHRAYRQLKRLLRDLVHYAKRHPWKVFFLVVMPLVTGGALTALLARFGLRMPPSLERMLGMASRAATGDSFGLVNDAVRGFSGYAGGSGAARGRDAGMQWERRSVYGPSVGGGGSRAGGGWEDSIMGVAKMFV